MFRAIAIVFITPLFMFGCGSYHAKNDKPIPNGEVATLDVSTSFFGPSIFVHSIDGISRGIGLYSDYKLAPGRRVVTVFGNSQAGLYTWPTNFVFVPEEGKEYKLVYLPVEGSRYWNAKIIDKETGERKDIEQYQANCTENFFTGWDCSNFKSGDRENSNGGG